MIFSIIVSVRTKAAIGKSFLLRIDIFPVLAPLVLRLNCFQQIFLQLLQAPCYAAQESHAPKRDSCRREKETPDKSYLFPIIGDLVNPRSVEFRNRDSLSPQFQLADIRMLD